MADDTEDSVALSGEALAALQDFYAERDAHAERLEKLKAQVEANDRERAARESASQLSIHTFAEDWNESQFWYSDETANVYANQLLEGASDDSVIAVVSTPSVFVALKNIMSAAGYTGPKPKTYLLEHDQRFAVFPEFLFYDFAQPFKLPPHLKGNVDRMICDPPFLSEDCQTKLAMTMRWLSRGSSSNTPRVLICTGERMKPLITRLYRPLGVRTTTYEPVHQGLKNEFYCYANFECEAWQWQKEGGKE
ncbi:putative N6-adenine methyltransferase-domain-containing protein [Xylariaceae sp. AK1471]|nr:putative N6-adenine methyltransferase-domain-containing protein [Xylariaceae sp. AK1471]